MTIRPTKMGDRHVDDSAELFGATSMPGSGNQWRAPADWRQPLDGRRVSFAGECKSTLRKGISITRDMITKVLRQTTGGWRPMLLFRFYDDERCTRVFADWVAMQAQDAAELYETALGADRARQLLELYQNGHVQYPDQYGDQGVDYLVADLIALLDGRRATRGHGLPEGGFPEEEG